MTAVLEACLQLQWLTQWREEAKTVEQWNIAREMNIVKDQVPGEEQYSDRQEQI